MMKKLLLLALFFASITFAQDNSRARFLFFYYGGDYPKAHELIKEVYSDPITRSIWEERIHLQSAVKNCKFERGKNPAARGLALLRSGAFEESAKLFGDDWLSLLGKAQLAIWQNKQQEAREYVNRAVTLEPERPETLFFAGNTALTVPESIAYFEKLLTVIKDDPYRKQLVEYSIAFMNKTKAMQLNVCSRVDGIEEIETEHTKGQLIIRTVVDGVPNVRLMVDTGAGGLTLRKKEWQPQIATDLLMFGIGKSAVIQGTRVVLSQFVAGDFNVTNPVAAISNQLPGDRIEGITGTAIFSNHLILVPVKPGQKFSLFQIPDEDPIDFLKNNGIQFSEKNTFPFYLVNKVMILKGKIRNSPADMDLMLDTGAERTMLSASSAKKYAHVNYALSNQVNKNSTLTGVGGRAENLLAVENVTIEIGMIKKDFNRMLALNLAEGSEAMELELDGILGRDFLEDYTLLIDYRNNKVTFLR